MGIEIIYRINSQDIVPPKALIGEKAAHIWNISRLGLNIPNSIIITTDFFRCFLQESQLENTIFFKKVNIFLSENFKSKIIDSVIPNSLLTPLLKQCSTLNGDSFAIRSSIPFNSVNKYSFSGILESFLFVDRENIDIALKKVWASLLSIKSIKYQELIKTDKRIKNIAVIIQEMIHPDFSGVLLSDRRTGKIVIEIVAGECTSITNGDNVLLSFIYSERDGWNVIRSKENIKSLPIDFLGKDIFEQLMQVYSIYKPTSHCIEFAIKAKMLYVLEVKNNLFL